MNGKNLLLDTNAVLYILADDGHKIILKENIIYISFITELELLSYPAINESEIEILKKFINRVEVIDINSIIKEKTIELRKKYRLKLPDAIIAASALTNNFIFVTNDIKLLKIKEIDTLSI